MKLLNELEILRTEFNKRAFGVAGIESNKTIIETQTLFAILRSKIIESALDEPRFDSNQVQAGVMQKIASIIDEKISELRIENRETEELSSHNIYEWTACIGILNDIKKEIESNFSA